jgi:hypothetical protein
MHGTEPRDLESRTFRFSATRKPVSPPSGNNASKHAASVIFSKTGPVARNGLSLPCNDCPFQGLHSRIEVPGLLLRFFTNRFHCPFGPLLHNPFRFAPKEAASTHQARCNFPGRLPGCSSSLHSPLGLFGPSRSKCSTGVAAVRPAFRLRPIPIAPHSLVLFLRLAADHRSRSATFPEACCSSNLLEPSS